MTRSSSKTFAFSVEGVISNKGFYDPGKVYQGMKGLKRTDQKTSWIIGFDSSNRQICCERISMEDITEDTISSREVFGKLTHVFRRLIIIDASWFIYVHRVECIDDMKPNDDDITLTNQLSRAAWILGLKLQDHIIIGDKGYYSFIAHDLLLDKFDVDISIEKAIEELIFLREHDDPKEIQTIPGKWPVYHELLSKIYGTASLVKLKIANRRPKLHIVPRKQS